MPFEPLCFIHASGPLVDSHPDDIPHPPEHLRETIENGTATVFDRIISTAIERGVDFLLLTGDCFSAADDSLRAEILLKRGFRRLCEHDIRVFIVPGFADGVEAWRTIRDLPDNVTTLLETNDDPVAVIRDGKVIASVATLDRGSLSKRSDQIDQATAESESHRGPMKIGLLVLDQELGKHSTLHTATSEGVLSKILADCRFDYLALGGAGQRCIIAMKTGVAHHPGTAQGSSADETGPRGCTLVDVDQTGAVRCLFVPTAVLRWEKYEINVDAKTTHHQMVAKFRDALEGCRTEPGEQVWLLNWRIRGDGGMFDALADESHRLQMLEAIELAATLEEAPYLFHTFEFIPSAEPIESPSRSEMLLADFLNTYDALNRPTFVSECYEESVPDNPVRAATLKLLIQDFDEEQIAAEVRRLGTSWFAPRLDERAVS